MPRLKNVRYFNGKLSRMAHEGRETRGAAAGFVLFIAVKLCRLPTLSDHIRRCELFGIPQDR